MLQWVNTEIGTNCLLSSWQTSFLKTVKSKIFSVDKRIDCVLCHQLSSVLLRAFTTTTFVDMIVYIKDNYTCQYHYKVDWYALELLVAVVGYGSSRQLFTTALERTNEFWRSSMSSYLNRREDSNYTKTHRQQELLSSNSLSVLDCITACLRWLTVCIRLDWNHYQCD